MFHITPEIVLGAPGTGKTYELLRILRQELEAGTPPNRIALCTFTRKASEEALDRVLNEFGLTKRDVPHFRTIHSIAMRYSGLSGSVLLEGSKVQEFASWIGETIHGRISEDGSWTGYQRGDRLLFMVNLARIRRVTLRSLYEADHDDLDWSTVERFARGLHHYKQELRLSDYSDLLERFVVHGQNPSVDVLLVDEAQDLSLLQWDVVRKIGTTCRRIVVAGDDDQCQPRGTLVSTTVGQVPIEDLNPECHKLLGFDKYNGCVAGSRGGATFQKASRHYAGNIFTVSIRDGEYISKCTYNHRWLVRWAPEIKKSTADCVYIMKRGDWFRVGHCQMFRADGIFHPTARANLEKADALWVLKVLGDKKEAFCYEQIISAKYGIPQLPFEPVNAKQEKAVITYDLIQYVFDTVDSKSPAIRALNDHNLSVYHPFIDRLKPTYNRFGSVTFEMFACNLISEHMVFPVQTSHTKTIEWLPATVSCEWDQRIVWSLNVENETKTYISNKMITHNSIFEWAGADSNTIIDMSGSVNVLDQSYRVPIKVQNLANNLIQRVKHRRPKVWRPREEPGIVRTIGSFDDADFTSPDGLDGETQPVMVLARNRFQLDPVCELLKSAGIVYEREGLSSIPRSTVDAIVSWERLRRGEAQTVKEIVDGPYALMSVGIGIKRGFKTLKTIPPDVEMSMSDLMEYGGLLTDAVWHEALDKLPATERLYIQRCRRNGERLTTKPRVLLSTVHGAKGGEAGRVILMTDLAPRSWREAQRNPDAEARVFYVGATRAKQELCVVKPQTGRYFEI